jgi:hypothetical protein
MADILAYEFRVCSEIREQELLTGKATPLSPLSR